MSTLNSDSGYQFTESFGSYSFVDDQKPCECNSSNLDLAPAAKWQLNHFGLEKKFSLDRLNVLEAEKKHLDATHVNGNAKALAENKLIEDYCNVDSKYIAAFCSDSPLKHFCSHCQNSGDSSLLDFESTINDDFFSNAHLVGPDSCNCLLFERPKKLCADLDSVWVGVKKIEPWWHAVDKEDLASSVSQTSSHCIRNCYHQGVQSVCAENVSRNCVFCFGQCEEQIIGKETKVSNMAACIQGNLASVGKDKSLGKQGLMESILQKSDKTFSINDSFNTIKVDSAVSRKPSGDLSRTELLEALCHSQTRAREAEELAQKACYEKDHVVNIFFQQASRLFAYKQWLRMLQLETLLLHLSSKDRLLSVHTPSALPWIGNKCGTLRKNGLRAVKKESGEKRRKVSKCAIAFAIGLGLAGAGLLVGWTLGWLFPAF